MKSLRSSYPATTLLGGMAYTNSASTDIRKTFARIREQNKPTPTRTEAMNKLGLVLIKE
jgi:hypothetical protein